MSTIGLILQIIVIGGSLLTNALLSSKHYRRWGYLLGLVNLGCWALMELYYRQWFMLLTNPVYLFIWIRGLQNHWKDKDLEKSEVIRRLKNINDVVQIWLSGRYENIESQLAALSFILCESDLSLKKGKKNDKKKPKTRR